MRNQESYSVRVDPSTGRPFFWRKWSDEQRRLYLRRRAQRAGLDIEGVEKLIREVIEHITPDLRRMFKTDIPYRINEAIRELRTRQARPRAKRYTYDRNGNVMSIE